MIEIPIIDTPRVRLRSFRSSDVVPFADYFADPVSSRFLGGPVPKVDAWRRMAGMAGQWILNGFGPFAIEDRATGRFAGYAGPWFPFDWPEPEIMWGLHADFRGRGYATEAAGVARRWAYRALGWTTAISLIDPDNTASRRVADRLGARPDGDIVIRGHAVTIHRHPAPSHVLDQN
jgi:RimJ/RimL family protein N-acetyltransferase